MTTETLPAAHGGKVHGQSTVGKITFAGARVLFGFIFFTAGVNGLFQFVEPPVMSGRAAAFMDGLAASGYLFPLLFTTYIVAGGALLAGRFVPLALVVLAPAVVNIFAFHAALAPHGMPIAILVVALELLLAWQHRDAYRPLFLARAQG